MQLHMRLRVPLRPRQRMCHDIHIRPYLGCGWPPSPLLPPCAGNAAQGCATRAGLQVGIISQLHTLPEGVSQAEVAAAVRRVCDDAHIDGLLVQLPLPRHLNEDAIIDTFDPAKDVDGFHPLNMG